MAGTLREDQLAQQCEHSMAGKNMNSVRWRNLELVTQSEVSQKEKSKQHINTCRWKLEKWY